MFSAFIILGIIYLADAYRVHTRKAVSEKVMDRIQGEELEAWCKVRVLAKTLNAIGFILIGLSYLVPANIDMFIGVTGLLLIVTNPVITVRNNKKWLKAWSSTML